MQQMSYRGACTRYASFNSATVSRANCGPCRMPGMQVHTEQSLANVVKFDTSACQVCTLQRAAVLFTSVL